MGGLFVQNMDMRGRDEIPSEKQADCELVGSSVEIKTGGWMPLC
jgi:hypothetical protein